MLILIKGLPDSNPYNDIKLRSAYKIIAIAIAIAKCKAIGASSSPCRGISAFEFCHSRLCLKSASPETDNRAGKGFFCQKELEGRHRHCPLTSWVDAPFFFGKLL